MTEHLVTENVKRTLWPIKDLQNRNHGSSESRIWNRVYISGLKMYQFSIWLHVVGFTHCA